MNKLIIDNRTDLTDYEALLVVGRVVNQGRISNYGKQYCYGTALSVNHKRYMVSTDLNKKSDRFIISKIK